jgi:hypothetical protein
MSWSRETTTYYPRSQPVCILPSVRQRGNSDALAFLNLPASPESLEWITAARLPEVDIGHLAPMNGPKSPGP